MSEQILKALMQLFAIIATPDSHSEDRKTVVESFLKRQLNQELVKEYLKVFNAYYLEYQDKQKKSNKQNRIISSSSVRVLKICTQINEELTQKQKIIVLFQLFEFAKSDSNDVTKQELEFIITVAEIFHIPDEEHLRIKEFVINSFDSMLNSDKILLIDNNTNFEHPRVKHYYSERYQGVRKQL